MNLNLKRFNMNMVQDDAVVALVAARNSGKSVLIKDLMYHKQHMPVGTVISPTEVANSFLVIFIPPLFIHSEYSDEIVQKILMRQQKVIQQIKKQEQKGGGKSNY